VINAGVPGYTSFQGVRYLEEEGLGLRPDLVIACFGFNDAEEWGEKGDREIAAGLMGRGIDRFFSRSRFYALWKGGIGRLRRGAAAGGGKPRPRVSAEEFYRNLLEMKRLCASRGAGLILLIWPYRKQRINGERRLIVYQPLIERAGREGRIPGINLIDPFLDAEESPYLDHIHANEEGCRLVAEVVAETISRARIR